MDTTTESHARPRPPFPKQKQKAPGLESEVSPAPEYEAPFYKAAGKLQGKTALITGGDIGIGRAVAVLFAREGADVAITYLPEEQSDAEQTLDAVESEGRECLLLPGDLSTETFCFAAVENTVSRFGKIEILVSNAAHQNRKNSLEEVTAEEWDKTFRVNVYAYFHLVRAALKHMGPGASIIATSSETAILGPKELPDYSATKGAINSFSKSLAKSLVERGIRVNVVAPGPVWTPLNIADAGAPEEKISNFGIEQPIRRPAQPEEIAPAYVFLASEGDASYVTGAIIAETGGLPLS